MGETACPKRYGVHNHKPYVYNDVTHVVYNILRIVFVNRLQSNTSVLSGKVRFKYAASLIFEKISPTR